MPPADPAPAAADDLSVDVDLGTALALVRANTRALAALSVDYRRAIADALRDEISLQEAQDSPVTRLVAAILKTDLNDLG